MAGDRLTWLHCSDFHVGKDRTAHERLLGKIVEHVRERVASDCVPDLVFITGVEGGLFWGLRRSIAALASPRQSSDTRNGHGRPPTAGHR